MTSPVKEPETIHRGIFRENAEGIDAGVEFEFGAADLIIKSMKKSIASQKVK